MNYKETIAARTKETEQLVKEFLPKEEGFQKTVIEAMNYSFLAGGKRLRPLIMHESYKAFGGDSQIIKPFMAALEMIHNYSLVHDDLPEMDNDELRRGMPTTHIKYGPGMAVLAGDGLLNYAFETATKAFDLCETIDDYKRVSRALRVLASKAGIYGMIGGQTLDVEAADKGLELSEEAILFIDENKTAALLQAAFMIGAILAGADDEVVDQLEKIGYNVGVAFQLQDDILDITSTTEVLGKPVGSDVEAGKVTHISVLGFDETVNRQKLLSKEASEAITDLSLVAKDRDALDFLAYLTASLADRTM